MKYFLVPYAVSYLVILVVGLSTENARILVARKRSTNGNDIRVRVEADDKVFHLELVKKDSPFAKSFSIIRTGKSSKETHIKDRSSLPQLFTDRSGESTVLLTENRDGTFAIEGILNKRYVIVPSDTRHGGSQTREMTGNKVEHLVFQREEQNPVSCDGVHRHDDEDEDEDENENYDGKEPTAKEYSFVFTGPFFPESPSLQNLHNDGDDNEEPTAEDFLFGGLFFSKSTSSQNLLVEMVVILDYNSTMAFDKDSIKVTNYLSIFYNEVQKIYRKVTDVNINLEIISVILTMDDSKDVIKDWVQPSTSVLKEFGQWLYETHPDLIFDSAMLHTMSDIRGVASGGNLTSATNGVAYIAQACVKNNKGKVNFNVGIIEDMPKQYTGIRTTAHELGHLLGCTHDGEAPVTSPKNQPSAVDCDPKDGYLMSYYPHNTNAFYFSPCSLKQLKWFSELSISKCMKEKPSKTDVVPLGISMQSLPGFNISLQQQCENTYGPNSVVHDPNPAPLVCTQLWCRNTGEDKPSFRGPALEGTQCGTDKICNLGECMQTSIVRV